MGVRCERQSEPLVGYAAGLRQPIQEIGFDPDRSTAASAVGPEQISLDLVSVPGASAEVLCTAFERFYASLEGERPTSTSEIIGDREVRWSKGPGGTGAQWYRDGLICSVSGSGVSRRLLLEGIEQMP
jgi:hypothetical protein